MLVAAWKLAEQPFPPGCALLRSELATSEAEKPLFLILPGVTADAARFESCQELARSYWPEAHVVMPNYLSRVRGVEGVGHWLDDWSRDLDPSDPVYVLAYILGGAALPYAPALMARVRRLALVRSRYQEGVPRALTRRFTRIGAALLFGKALADLGTRPYWPAGFEPPCPTLVLLESRPTQRALLLKVPRMSDEGLGLHDAREVDVDHDAAYRSAEIMRAAVEWLRQT